jgi:hypothetical protein
VGPRPARALQSARRQRPARRSSRARGRMVRRVRRDGKPISAPQSRAGSAARRLRAWRGRSPRPQAQSRSAGGIPLARSACRPRRPSTCTRAHRWSRTSESKRRDVAGRQRGRCDPSRGTTNQGLDGFVVKTKRASIGYQGRPVFVPVFGFTFSLDSPSQNSRNRGRPSFHGVQRSGMHESPSQAASSLAKLQNLLGK